MHLFIFYIFTKNKTKDKPFLQYVMSSIAHFRNIDFFLSHHNPFMVFVFPVPLLVTSQCYMQLESTQAAEKMVAHYTRRPCKFWGSVLKMAMCRKGDSVINW